MTKNKASRSPASGAAAASADELTALMTRRLDGEHWLVMFIDGFTFANQQLVGALGVTAEGVKVPLAVMEGTTEDEMVVIRLLADLRDRGLDVSNGILFVVDGSDELTSEIPAVFGRNVAIQRCRLRKERHVLDQLPHTERIRARAKLRNAWATADSDVASVELASLGRALERQSPAAASSLKVGLDETLTVTRLGIKGPLLKTVFSTNPVKSMVKAIPRDPQDEIKSRDGEAALRQAAAGMESARSQFRRVKGYRQLPRLAEALEAATVVETGQREAQSPETRPNDAAAPVVGMRRVAQNPRPKVARGRRSFAPQAPWALLGTDEMVPIGIARVAFGLVAAYLVVSRLIEDVYTLPVGVSLHPTDVILAALLGTWILWRVGAALPIPTGIVSALGATLIIVFLSAPFLNALNMTEFEADGAERGLVRAVLFAGLFITTYHLALSRRTAIRILAITAVVTIVQGTLAVYEAVTGARLLVLGSIWQTAGLEVDPRGTRSAAIALQQRLTGELRVSATAPHPLVLVGLLGVGIGICIAFYLHSESRRVRAVLLGAIAIQLIALGATNQRTAFVVLAVLALAVGLTQMHKLPSAFPLVIAAAIGGVAVVLVSPNTPRLILDFITGQQTDHNVAVRTGKYLLLPELIERRPLIGAGFSTSDPSVVTFDNGYLTELVEFGIFGFAVLLAFLLVVAGRSYAALPRALPSDQPILLSAVLAAAVLFASMVTFDAMSFGQFFPTCLVVMAVGLARADDLQRHDPGEE